MTVNQKTLDTLRHLAGRPGHDEVKADFRALLIDEFGVDIGAIDFERRVPEVRGRLDALIGRTVFEAKSNLDKEWSDVERRMPDYLADREKEEKEKFVGVASDGLKWIIIERDGDSIVKVKETILNPDEAEQFLAWLEGALALKASLPPDALTITSELGQDSVAYHRVHGLLQELWDKLRNHPDAALKRQLWADLLKHVYGRALESDALWFQHTFLVIVAKCIALAVMELREDDPKKLLSGEAFSSAGVNGAVESDFFDWVIADPDGEKLVRRIMNHVRRFRLKEVESDVLKILYESLIDREERHGLGEYYTPDWLAAKVIRKAVERPLEQRVLDPACGSGTFLFHAIRNFLAEAEEAAMPKAGRAAEACNHIAGLDIHPVAVIIARVTYLLGLAPAIQGRAGSLSIPVYLGDSLQLSISEFMAGKELTVHVPPSPAGQGKGGRKDAQGREQLDFPDTFCRDPALFDKAIEQMRSGSLNDMTRQQVEAALKRITEQHCRSDLTEEQEHAIKDLGKTYVTFDRLRREGRDTVWAYVARNLSRPLAFSANGGWAHVVVGNPPWLAFRHMSADLQKRFKEMANGERVYVSRVPSHNDLCGLFSVRSASLYLRSGGRIGFVLPLAALSRGQFEKLRAGSFESVRIAWDEIWTMDDSVFPLFPVPSSVFFGKRRATAKPFPAKVRAFSGVLPFRDASEQVADVSLSVQEDAPAMKVAKSEGGSVYRKAFRQGAILVPRIFWIVERKIAGRLGGDPSAPLLVSRRSIQEKKPWKEVKSVEGQVESNFIKPALMGESIIPYHIFRPFEAVIPVSSKSVLLNSESAANNGYPFLSGWLREVENRWQQHNKSNRTSIDQLDYIGQLSAQFPTSKIRVVYAKAGAQPAACVVRDDNAVIDHKLYWTSVSSEAEARYLMAILNSEIARSRAERYQSRGQWGARDFDKAMFNLPIPRFDPNKKLHIDLADAGCEAEMIVAKFELPESVKFQRARRLVRDALKEAGVSEKIDNLVENLLDGK